MNAEYADQLVARAIQLQDQAAALERGAPQPQSDAQQQPATRHEPVQPDKDEG